MRLFVAVFPPPEVRDALSQAALALPENPFRLTPPERVHLTLKFLGETPPESLPRLTRALEPLRDHADPFEATVSRFGVFPSPRRARVLWAGIGAGAELLVALAEAAETLLEPEGFDREGRSFVPHLTLGRARRPVPFDPSGTTLPDLGFTVGSVDLVQSEHTGDGVAYSTIRKYELE